LGIGLLCVPNGVAAVGETWKKWIDKPVDIPFTLRVTNVYAASNSTYAISIADVELTAQGHGYSSVTNAQASGSAKLYKEYRLTVEGTNLVSYEIELDTFRSITALMPSRGLAAPGSSTLSRAANPEVEKTYKIFVDGEETSSISGSTNQGSPYKRVWTVEFRGGPNPRWSLDDDSSDPDTAPGEGSWVELGPGKSRFTNVCLVTWNVSLGHLNDGNRAGKIRIAEKGISQLTYDPVSLYYTAKSTNVRSQLELIVTNLNNGAIRQVRAPQVFVDIEPTNHQYSLRFYHLSNISTNTNSVGLYTVLTNNPFVVWEVINPDRSTNVNTRLHIVEVRNGARLTNNIQYTPSAGSGLWQITEGIGAETRQKTRTVSFNGVTTNRLETVETKYATGATSTKFIEEYHQYPWGWELLKATTDPDGAALVTQFAYYDNFSEYADGRLRSIVYPDGHWEKHSYGGDNPGWLYLPGSHWILRPWQSDVTDPESANPGNSHTTVYEIGVDGEDIEQSIRQYYAGDPLEWDFGGKLGEYDFMEYPDSSLVRRRQEFRQSSEGFVYNNTYIYRDDAGPGKAEHPALITDWETHNDFNYYDFGFYNAQSNRFTIASGSNDWRKTIVHGANCLYDNGCYPEWNGALQFEGHQVSEVLNQGHVKLVPFASIKETMIYTKGALVQRERYVYTSIITNEPQFELLDIFAHKNDSLGRVTNIVRIDPALNSKRTVYSADWRGTNSQDGSLKLAETDELGTVTKYSYDGLKRVAQLRKVGVNAAGTYAAQADIVTNLTYDASDRKLAQRVVGGLLSVTNASEWDLTGRITSETDGSGLTTSYQYANGGRMVTKNLPGGATRIEQYYHDRRLQSITGTGVTNEYHYFIGETNQAYWVFYTELIRYGSSASPRWRRIGNDGSLERPFLWDSPTFGNTNLQVKYIHYPLSLPAFETNTGQSRIEFFYDMHARTRITSIDTDSAYGLAWPTKDRPTRREVYFAKEGGHWFEITTNTAYLTDNSAVQTLVSAEKARVTGFPATTLSQVTLVDANSNSTIITRTINLVGKIVTETVSLPFSTIAPQTVTRNGLVQSESSPSVSTPTTFKYDTLGRRIEVKNPIGNSSTTTYDPASGRISRETDFAGNITVYDYYDSSSTNAGRLRSVTSPVGRKTCYSYNLRGQINRTWGAVPYPEERVYNEYGEMTSLKSYRGGSGWSGADWPANPGTADTTTFAYQESTGLLTNRTDPAGKSISFTYDDARRIVTTKLARNLTTTNIYDANGDLVRINYSDSAPSIVFTNSAAPNYTRAGLPRMVTDASGTRFFIYDHDSRVVSENWTNGIMNGVSVTNRYHPIHGRERFTVAIGAIIAQADYTFDAFGRLGGGSMGSASAAYSYLQNTDLPQTIAFTNNGTRILTTGREWEYGMRLRSIASVVSNSIVSRHTYVYNALHLRTQVSREDGSFWKYGYNDRDEIVLGKRYWDDLSPVAGQHFEYAYDNIGNRSIVTKGGDVDGLNLRSIQYTSDNVNQYGSITTPGYESIFGVAIASNTVAVNGATADRKGEYFHKEISVGNSGGPIWQTSTVNSGTFSTNGGFVFPRLNQTCSYDVDGNLTFDGVWAYAWDAKNRPVSITMTNVSGVPDTMRKRVEYQYDYLGRRISKTVSTWNGAAFASPTVTRFIYDDWKLIAEVDANGNALRTRLWGLDLSGNDQAAAGVGGLLVIRDVAAATNHFVSYDGNGNVVALVAQNGSLSARYDYGPFGEPVRVTGPFAASNSLRWSTKFTDDECGIVYYGLRSYNPSTGRWISRDPALERGGNNLYAFNFNNAITRIDGLGDVSGGWDNNGFHIHDGDLSYGVAHTDDGGFRVFANPTHPGAFDQEKATASFRKLLSTEKGVKHFQAMIGTMHQPNASYGSAWDALPNHRNMLSGMGRNAWRALKAAGKVAGIIAIAGAIQATSQAAVVAENYGRALQQGDVAMADLEAVELALLIHEGTGNYFMAYLALDVLLQ
jgi:RHS repeat-associated protein